jgi:penicillin-binding protein 1C
LGDYVLVVWLGNFQGKGNPALVGRKAAAPLLFAMFEALNIPNKQEAAPGTVVKIDLCAVSGQLPTKCCQHQLSGWFIPGVSSVQACQIHQEVLIDTATNLRVARDDGSKALRREVHEFWPPDLMQTFAQAGLPRRPPPAWAPGEAADTSGKAPRIQSPLPQRVYTVSKAHPAIPLRAETAAGVQKVFWFSGKAYLGSSSPTQAILWHPKPGQWPLQVTDDAGRSAQCVVTVE